MVAEPAVTDEMANEVLRICYPFCNGSFHAVFRYTMKARATAIIDLEKRHHDEEIRPCECCLLQPLISYSSHLSL
jgi:hypothetical protein